MIAEIPSRSRGWSSTQKTRMMVWSLISLLLFLIGVISALVFAMTIWQTIAAVGLHAVTRMRYDLGLKVQPLFHLRRGCRLLIGRRFAPPVRACWSTQSAHRALTVTLEGLCHNRHRGREYEGDWPHILIQPRCSSPGSGGKH